MAKLSDLPGLVASLLKQESVLEEAAKEIKKSIPIRTRLGKGVRENLGGTHPLPQLTETTVKIRKSLKKKGRLTGPKATPKKSGLNRTGDLLNSLDAKVSSGKIEVAVAPNEEKKINEVLVINPDYQFMRLSSAEFKRVLKSISDKINVALSKVNITDL